SHRFELGHALEQNVEGVGHELLRRAAIDRTGQTQLEVTLAIETKRECGLAFAPGRRARTRGPARSGSGTSYGSGNRDDRGGSFASDLVGLGLVNLGSIVDFLVFRLIGAKTIDDFRLLMVNRRIERSQGGRVGARMLDDLLAERVVRIVARGFGGLGRFEAHIVPAEVFEAVSALTKALRPHGRAGSALAGEKA